MSDDRTADIVDLGKEGEDSEGSQRKQRFDHDYENVNGFELVADGFHGESQSNLDLDFGNAPVFKFLVTEKNDECNEANIKSRFHIFSL